MTIIPMVDCLVKLKVTGEQLLLALENGVSKYPQLEGRFPQVSGMSFTFDPSKPSGSRVSASLVQVGEERLQKNKMYTLCTRQYIASGKDGYSVFKKAQVLIEEERIILDIIVRYYFQFQPHPINDLMETTSRPR